MSAISTIILILSFKTNFASRTYRIYVYIPKQENFASSKSKAEEELARLTVERQRLLNEGNDAPVIDMVKVKTALDAMLDFSDEKLSRDFLDKVIGSVTAIDNNHFEWTVNISPDKASAVPRCAQRHIRNRIKSQSAQGAHRF